MLLLINVINGNWVKTVLLLCVDRRWNFQAMVLHLTTAWIQRYIEDKKTCSRITIPNRVGPWEKVSQNIDPFKNHFLSLMINTGLGQVHHSHFWPPRTPGGVWGALGGFGGVCRPQNCHFCSETNFSPGMQCFGLKQLVTLCFWGLGSNGALLGQKMAVLGPNRVCKKVDFSQKHHLQICPNRTKGALLSQ